MKYRKEITAAERVNMNTKTILYLLLVCGLFSCSAPVAKKVPMDQLAYDLCLSLKQNNKDKFRSYFDEGALNSVSASQFDYVFNSAVAVATKYELPSFELWKQNRIFFENDSVNRIIRLGLPFIRKATTASPESYFKISYNAEQKFTGINLQQVTAPGNMPDSQFPIRRDKFAFSEQELLSIRLYFLPGQNADPELSHSVEFKGQELTEAIKTDFKRILDRLNASEIVSAQKGAIQEQTNTNDLKAVQFEFREGREVLNLCVLNPTKLDKYLEVNGFYSMNAAVLYRLSEKDKAEMQQLLDQYISKYIKE